MRRPENLKLKYFLEKMTLSDVWKLFSYVFLWRWRSKGLVVLNFEKCEHRDDTSIVDGNQSQRCEVLIVFCVERPSKEGEYLGETKRTLKERVSGHRNQTTSAIRNHHISTKYPKAELKDFTITDKDSNTLHHWTKQALQICIQDPSLNRNIGKVRIPPDN